MEWRISCEASRQTVLTAVLGGCRPRGTGGRGSAGGTAAAATTTPTAAARGGALALLAGWFAIAAGFPGRPGGWGRRAVLGVLLGGGLGLGRVGRATMRGVALR